MYKYLTIAIILIFSTSVSGQHLASSKGQGAIGIGIGLPYGALGGKISYNVAEQTSVFTGIGYNLADVAYNIGLMYSFKSEKSREFYISGMYGRNASLIVEDFSPDGDFKESYLGPSFGAGLPAFSSKNEGSFWEVGLVVPIRSSDYNNDIDAIKNIPSIELTEPWPVLIVIGYNFGL